MSKRNNWKRVKWWKIQHKYSGGPLIIPEPRGWFRRQWNGWLKNMLLIVLVGAIVGCLVVFLAWMGLDAVGLI